MRPRVLSEVAAMLGGATAPGLPASVAVREVAIDSRTLSPGALFFAIQGERDGVEFAPDALARGAVAAVVPHGASHRVPGPSIEVDDPRRALGRLAAAVRCEEAARVRAVAVTGSLGKTTTCGYLGALLAPLGPVHRPPSSYNNDLGVPLTILGAPDETRVLVLELGTNAPGEIEPLAGLSRADVGVVTAIAPVHLAGLGDLSGVEREKLSLLRGLPENARGWVPAEHLAAAVRHGSRVRSFGRGGEVSVEATDGDPMVSRWLGDHGERSFRWSPTYRHQRTLLAAALAVGGDLGVSPEALLAAIPALPEPPLRGEVRHAGAVEMILDCYNASPASMRASIERLEDEPAAGRRVCVIGTMEELGPEEERWHRELGERLGRARVDVIYRVGRAADWTGAGLMNTRRESSRIPLDDAGAASIAASLRPGDRILFKASRRERLERFAEQIAACLSAEGTRREAEQSHRGPGR